MFYKCKKNNKEVSRAYQSEDKNERYDYGKTRIDISSGIIGDNDKIRDSR